MFYKKESDKDILDQIKPVIAARPTYGYKRVTRMVNRVRLTLDLPVINKKKSLSHNENTWFIASEERDNKSSQIDRKSDDIAF